MALFKESQNHSIVQNQFWELPDHYWIGPMLVNKHTLAPVAGYDVPIAQVGWIPPQTAAESYTATSWDTWMNYMRHNTNLYQMCTRGSMFATMLGQTGFMAIGQAPVRYVAPSNDLDDVQRAYIRDKDDLNKVYLLVNGDSVGDTVYLTKYDLATHKVLWSVRALNSGSACRIEVYRQDDDFLYCMYSGPDPNGFGTNREARTRFNSSYDHNRFSDFAYWGIPSYEYFALSGLYLLRVRKDTGVTDWSKGNCVAIVGALYQWSSGDGHDIQYLGQNEHGHDMFFCAKTCADTNIIGNVVTNTYACFSIVGYDWTSDVFSMLGNRVTSEKVNGRYRCEPTALYGDNNVHFDMPKFSRPDKEYTDRFCLYGYAVEVSNNNQYGAHADGQQEHQIVRVQIKDSETKYENLLMLNKDGVPMTGDDWNKNTSAAHFSKFYVHYGNDGKKFLSVHQFTCYAWAFDNTRATQDAMATTYVFKFVNDSTIQLCDSLDINCTDLLWIDSNRFVAARYDRIRIYDINMDTGEIKLLRTVLRNNNTNYFAWIHVDDMRNLWFTETGFDSTHPSMGSYRLYFLNSLTIAALSITPESLTYTYSGTNISTYVDISALGDLGDPIARKVKLTASGPVQFDNNTKSLITQTSIEGDVRVPITITGSGDVSVTMVLSE